MINYILKYKAIYPANTLWRVLFFSLAAFPFFGPKVAGFIIFAWVSISLILAVKKRTIQTITLKEKQTFFALTTPFIIQIIGFTLSSDLSEALFSIEKSLPLLVVPFGFLISIPFIKMKDVKIALIVFIISCFILNSYVLISGVVQGVFFRLDEANIYNPIVRNLYTDLTHTHLPYLGLWFMFAILCVIHLILNFSFTKKIKFFLFFVAVELATGAFLFSARMAILSFIIAAVFYFAFYFKSLKKILIFISFIAISLVILSRIPTFSYRIKEITEGKLSPPKGKPWDPHGDQYSSINLRVGIIICSYELLQQNWLFGVGTSEVQPLLNECYTQFPIEGHDDYKHIEYNTHNQYIHFWLSSGLIGIILFLLSLIYLLLLSYNSNNLLLITFFIFVSISFLTENILSRYAGIIFFSFLSSILSFKIYYRKEK